MVPYKAAIFTICSLTFDLMIVYLFSVTICDRKRVVFVLLVGSGSMEQGRINKNKWIASFHESSRQEKKQNSIYIQ